MIIGNEDIALIQRTKDGSLFRIDDAYWQKSPDNIKLGLTREEFLTRIKGSEVETFDPYFDGGLAIG